MTVAAPSRRSIEERNALVKQDSIPATKVFYLDTNRQYRQEEKEGEADIREECELLRMAINCLDDRQRLILILRYGLNGDKPQSLSQIAGRVNVTRQRVAQIQKKAEHTLRVALSCCEEET